MGKKFDSHINNVKGLLNEEIAPGNKELIIKDNQKYDFDACKFSNFTFLL